MVVVVDLAHALHWLALLGANWWCRFLWKIDLRQLHNRGLVKRLVVVGRVKEGGPKLLLIAHARRRGHQNLTRGARGWSLINLLNGVLPLSCSTLWVVRYFYWRARISLRSLLLLWNNGGLILDLSWQSLRILLPFLRWKTCFSLLESLVLHVYLNPLPFATAADLVHRYNHGLRWHLLV